MLSNNGKHWIFEIFLSVIKMYGFSRSTTIFHYRPCTERVTTVKLHAFNDFSSVSIPRDSSIDDPIFANFSMASEMYSPTFQNWEDTEALCEQSLLDLDRIVFKASTAVATAVSIHGGCRWVSPAVTFWSLHGRWLGSTVASGCTVPAISLVLRSYFWYQFGHPYFQNGLLIQFLLRWSPIIGDQRWTKWFFRTTLRPLAQCNFHCIC